MKTWHCLWIMWRDYFLGTYREKSSSKQLNFVEMNESSSRPTQNSILQTQSPLDTSSKKPLNSLSDMTDTKVSPSLSHGYQENSSERPSPRCTVPSISFQSEKPSLPNVFQPRAKQDCSSVKPAEEVHPAQGHLSLSEVQNNSYRTPINKSMAMSSAGGRNSGGRQVYTLHLSLWILVPDTFCMDYTE